MKKKKKKKKMKISRTHAFFFSCSLDGWKTEKITQHVLFFSGFESYLKKQKKLLLSV